MDYYHTLGVQKTATQSEIKQAYRRLASKHHPDKGGDTATFQRIEEAYRILSDEQARQQYDNPAPQFGGFPGGFNFNVNGTNPFEEILQQFTRQTRQARQRAYTVTVFVTLEQVAQGSTENIQIQTDNGLKTFQIQIPQSIEDNQRIRYDGLMPDGPLLVTFRIHRHKIFERRGLDLVISIDVSVFDLILGTTVVVPTIRGQNLEVTIRERTKPGSTLRIPNHGLEEPSRRGDQFVFINAVIPDTISTELISALNAERVNKSS
jgi:curved DNA-binding protein